MKGWLVPDAEVSVPLCVLATSWHVPAGVPSEAAELPDW